MARLLDQALHVDRTRQVLIVLSLLVLVFAIGLSFWGFGLLRGSGPDNDYANARSGTMVLTTRDDTVCRHMKFDNDSFRLSAIKTVPCDLPTSVDAAPPPPKDRGNESYLDSIREGFRNH